MALSAALWPAAKGLSRSCNAALAAVFEGAFSSIIASSCKQRLVDIGLGSEARIAANLPKKASSRARKPSRNLSCSVSERLKKSSANVAWRCAAPTGSSRSAVADMI